MALGGVSLGCHDFYVDHLMFCGYAVIHKLGGETC